MDDLVMDDFQSLVSRSLIRHKSIIDIMTKSDESSSRVNRAIAKSISRCGCISVDAKKQYIPENSSLEELPELLSSQIIGELCPNCREVIKEEIGSSVYYLAAICDALDISLYDVILEQYDKIKTLGKYTML